MAKVKITHEFDYYEESSDIKQLLSHKDCYVLLWDLDQEIRSKVKYGEDKWLNEDVADYLDSLRSMIHESGVMND